MMITRNVSKIPAMPAVLPFMLILLTSAFAAGGASPKLKSNSQVNMTAPAANVAGYVDNFPQNKQNEPAIARDPVTGAFVAGSNDEIDLSLCGQSPPWDPTLNNT